MKLDLIEIRRDLHRHPELAFEERRTGNVVAQTLESLGLEPRRAAKTGVIAEITGALPGPTIALRADIDALPLQEKTGLPFASVYPGKMHACGHDAHTTILLGAAERLLQNKDELQGTVRLLFQPAEEITAGAQAMIEDGALEDVSMIFGLHNAPGLPVGKAAFGAGQMLASSSRVSIEIQGKGGHAAMPHTTTDPVVAACAVVTTMQTLVSRAISPMQAAALSICKITAGEAFNIIPDRVVLDGTLRCLDTRVDALMPELIRNHAEHTAAAYRCTAEVLVEPRCPALINHPAATEMARRSAERVLGVDHVVDQSAMMASEDFAYYLNQVPGCFFELGSGSPYGVHHPEFNLDEDCLHVGAKLMAEIARDALRHPLQDEA